MRKCTGHPCTFFNGDDICDFCTERRNRLNDGVDSIKRGDVSLPVDAPAPSVPENPYCANCGAYVGVPADGGHFCGKRRTGPYNPAPSVSATGRVIAGEIAGEWMLVTLKVPRSTCPPVTTGDMWLAALSSQREDGR